MKEEIIKILLKESKKAYRKNEVPVACVITENNKIISKSYNKRENKNNPLYHAEVLAITKATKRKKTWKLNDCELYVTLEPCEMCKKIISETRIKKVYYLNESKYYKTDNVAYEKIQNNEEYIEILKKFFREKRK